MEKFVRSIKRKYRERLLHHEKQWPPVRGGRLFNLQLVEADKTEGFGGGSAADKVKRTPILHSDLFKVETEKKPVRKLIVEGNAGMGKTTLCIMLAEEWAKDKILTQFDCVLLLPLREKSVSTATNLLQLFKLLHSSEKIRTSVIEELEENEGEGVLIIADGWDEYNGLDRDHDSFLYELLFGDILPFASVLLTSRPTASCPLHDLPTVDRLVEVAGFSEESIKQYIESEFEKCPQKACSLVEQLEYNPVIQNVCSVPLNCAIICNLWHLLDQALPATFTELYTQIVLSFIFRNIKKSVAATVCPISLSSFDSIPASLESMFWLTCKFAYECLSRDQIVFSELEIASFFPEAQDSSSEILCFGLLQYTYSLLPVGQGLSFNFVHLTIQEFLAALHLATLPNNRKQRIFEGLARRNRFDMVWRFLFGLGCGKLRKCSKKIVSLDNDVVYRFVQTFSSFDWRNRLMLCHCSLESLNNDVSLKIAQKIDGRFHQMISFASIAQSPHDCIAVLNALRHTSNCKKMRINLSACGLTDNLLKQLSDSLSCTSGNQVDELYLQENKLTGKGVFHLFNRSICSLPPAQHTQVSEIRLNSFACLKLLSLENNNLGVLGVNSLVEALETGVLPNLERLSLSKSLTSDADINGALLTTLLPSIVLHCPHLWYFNLSGNNLGTPGACALADFFLLIVNSRSKFNLEIYSACINSEALLAFTDVITKHPCKQSQCAFRLNLRNNPLKYDGLVAILKMLRCETYQITYLYLKNADLGDVGPESCYTQPRADVPVLGLAAQNIRITNLCLDNNNFSGDKIFVLAESICVCTLLKSLSCAECFLTSAEITTLLTFLKSRGISHKNLLTWNLCNNSISDEGVASFLENLTELFPSLDDIFLESNPVKSEVYEKLKHFLEPKKKRRLSLERANKAKTIAEEKAKKNARRSAVLAEWERTYSPPQSEEMLSEFNQMWIELLSVMKKLFSKCRIDITVHSSTCSSVVDRTNHGTSCLPSAGTTHAVTNPDNKDVPERKTVTIEELMSNTKVTESQLNSQMEEKDILKLAAYFDNVENYLVHLGLTPSQRTDIKDLAFRRGTQTAMSEALRLWREPNPYTATYRALVKMLLDLGKGEVAVEVCTYLSSKLNQTS